tara:strand:- start:3499 stop:4752 length:1254 start_codon:yes stop_codon:yes gene_type:complete
MIKNYLNSLGRKSKLAFTNKIQTSKKNKVLNDFADLLKQSKKNILKNNLKDVKNAKNRKIKSNLIQRLYLNSDKIDQIIKSIKLISKLKDPENIILRKWSQPNGLVIKKITIPIGVIGIIYESRPNVTSDVSCLCFKSGNCVILKGGSESYNTNKIIVNLFKKSLKKNKLSENYIQYIENKNRKVVDFMLSKMKPYIDVIIPRGGKNLVKKVQQKSTIPIIGHLEGVCHTYVDKKANINMARKVILNAKLRNTGICGSTETILFHQNISNKSLNIILNSLVKNGCEIFADKKTRKIFKGRSRIASEKDWSTEYLAPKVSVRIVKNLQEAINHINKYGTMHTDAIITQDKNCANYFMRSIKSSIAIHNASTQFADGGEFGFGGEVGISTNNLPPRGPVGLNELVSYKYEVSGKGQIRD